MKNKPHLIIIFAATMLFLGCSKNNQVSQPIETTFPSNNVQSQPSVENPASQNNIQSDFQPPLERANERVTKKPFGIYITPANSPVSLERFSGYHTGTDFEIFPEELNADVPVKAVCSGKLFSKRSASGYGGVVVESCELPGQPITVVYGHLKLSGISKNVGDNLNAGETLGNLGAAYSAETNGERKHLHLSFHKGTAVNILGYVQNKTDLSNWIDPCLYVCQ